MVDLQKHPHLVNARGAYKYVLTQGDVGWRLTVVNGTDDEKAFPVCEAILEEALANLRAAATT